MSLASILSILLASIILSLVAFFLVLKIYVVSVHFTNGEVLSNLCLTSDLQIAKGFMKNFKSYDNGGYHFIVHERGVIADRDIKVKKYNINGKLIDDIKEDKFTNQENENIKNLILSIVNNSLSSVCEENNITITYGYNYNDEVQSHEIYIKIPDVAYNDDNELSVSNKKLNKVKKEFEKSIYKILGINTDINIDIILVGIDSKIDINKYDVYKVKG